MVVRRVFHCFFLLCLMTGIVQNVQSETLRILNWSNYIDLDGPFDVTKTMAEQSPTLRAFMEKENCAIEYYEYNSMEEFDALVHDSQHYYDVVILSTDMAQKLKEEGCLVTLSPDLVPNRANVNSYYIQQLKEGISYFVPYLVGTLGIIYRQDLTGKEVTQWKDYYQPGPELKGKMGAMNTYEMLFTTLKYLGIDIHTSNEEDLVKAAKAFYQLKKEEYLSLISSDVNETQEQLRQGKLAMAVLYSSDALSLIEQNPGKDLHFVLPLEGTEVSIDGLVVLESAPNRELACKFVNYMLEPETQASIAGYLNSWCTSDRAIEILKKKKPDMVNDSLINLPDELIKRLEIFSNPPTEREMGRLWSEINKPYDFEPFFE